MSVELGTEGEQKFGEARYRLLPWGWGILELAVTGLRRGTGQKHFGGKVEWRRRSLGLRLRRTGSPHLLVSLIPHPPGIHC